MDYYRPLPNKDLMYCPIMNFVGLKEDLPKDAGEGDLCICGTENSIYCKMDNAWTFLCTIEDAEISQSHPRICPQCGAPLKGNVCEYCGTRY